MSPGYSNHTPAQPRCVVSWSGPSKRSLRSTQFVRLVNSELPTGRWWASRGPPISANGFEPLARSPRGRAFGQMERPVNQRTFQVENEDNSDAPPAHLMLITKNRTRLTSPIRERGASPGTFRRLWKRDDFSATSQGSARVSHTTSSPSSLAVTWSRLNSSFSRTRSDGVFRLPTVAQSRVLPVAMAASSTARAASVA